MVGRVCETKRNDLSTVRTKAFNFGCIRITKGGEEMNKLTIGIVLGIGLLTGLISTELSESLTTPDTTMQDTQTVEVEPVMQEQENVSDVAITYKGHVDIYKVESNGKTTHVVSKDNLLVDNGKNYIRKQIGDGTSTASNSTRWISLSNDTTPPASVWTQILSEINANGFTRAVAIYQSNGTGAWNYTYEWTATASQSVQLTGLQYASTPASDGNLFAALQFAQQDLLINDKLKVVWSISVS